MKATRRLRFWLAALVVIMLAVTGLWLTVPAILERVGENYLKSQGAAEARLDFTSPGVNQISALNSRTAAEGWNAELDVLQIDYRLSTIWWQRLRRVHADGLRVTIELPAPLSVIEPLPSLEREMPASAPEREEPTPVAAVDPREREWEPETRAGEIPEPTPDETLPEPEPRVFPLADPFAVLYQLPVRELQVSRSQLVWTHAGELSPPVEFDLVAQLPGREDSWRLDLGTEGFLGHIDMLVDSERERVRLSGNLQLRDRKRLDGWESWLRGMPESPLVLPEPLDWSKLQLQFLNEWESGRLQRLSAEAELRDLSWYSEDRSVWAGSNHAMATWTYEGDHSSLFFGAGVEGLVWGAVEIGEGYAEGRLQLSEQRAHLEWGPLPVDVSGLRVGHLSGRADALLERGLALEGAMQWQTSGPVAEAVPVVYSGWWDLRNSAALDLRIGGEADGTRLELEGEWSDIGNFRGRGQLNARVESEALDWIPLDAGVPEALFGWNAGDLSAAVEWDYTGWLPRGSGSLVMDGLAWEHVGTDTEIRGLRGDLPFRFLGVPQIMGNPEIKADRFKLGDVTFEDLRLQFHMTALTAFHVEAMSALVADGTVSVDPFSFNPFDPDFTTELHLDELDARVIRDWLPAAGYRVEGRISGYLPVRIQDGDVHLGEGELRAGDREAAWFYFEDETLVRETIPLPADQLELGERFYEALMQGVRIDSLEIRILASDEPDMPLILRLSGEARSEHMVIPVEDLVIRNRVDPQTLRRLLDWLEWDWLQLEM